MPRIVVVDEKNISKTYTISRELTLGSAKANHVVLPASLASPKQAVIKAARKGFILTNLDPRHKILINNKAYRIKALRHGDMISLDNIVMFYDDEEHAPKKTRQATALAKAQRIRTQRRHLKGELERLRTRGSPPQRRSTQQGHEHRGRDTGTVRQRQRQYEDVACAVDKISQTGGADRKLAILLKVGATIFDEMNYKKLLRKVMEMIFLHFPADKGSIWIAEDKSNRLTPQLYRMHDKYLPPDKVQISKTIIQEVFKKKDAILTIDAMQDERFISGESIADQHIKSAMAAPLMRKKRIFGLIQIDTTSQRMFTPDHLELFSAITLQAAMAIDNARLYREVSEKRSMEDELSVASSIQQFLMPKKTPDIKGLDLYGTMIPAKHMGGDYYDFIPGPNKRDYFCIGDVSGKGVPAGLVMVMARSIIRPLIASDFSVKEIVEQLNRYIYESTAMGTFMTFFLLCWDQQGEKLIGCGAGHECMIYYHADTKKSELVRSGGRALGLALEGGKPYQEREMLMQPGDALILYTDGVTECMNAEREQFGLDYLLEIIDYHGYMDSKGICAAILSELESYRGNTPQSDDITILVVKKK